MDTTDPDITFDDKGVCSNCVSREERLRRLLIPEEARPEALRKLVEEVKSRGKGKKYDCIIGVSGGVDSTYVAYLVKETLGLRPLAVHLDNGWNSELAVKNIERVLNTLGIDLFTYVIDWEEFKDLQLSFLKASTPDSEIPTDHAIIATLHKTASEHNISYILNGVNVATESIMPLRWAYGYYDLRYITAVQRLFGRARLRTFPRIGLAKFAYYKIVRRIHFVPILNYIHYNKQEAMDILQNRLGWIYYGGKHYESIYTRFFQSYILPNKFQIDKRRAHYSNLVLAGEMTREEALAELQKPAFPPDKQKEERTYAIKKFGITEAEFESIMALPRKTFADYPNRFGLVVLLKSFRALARFRVR